MAEQAKKKNYVKGSAKIHTFDNGGEVIHLDMLLTDLQKMVNERGYVKVTLSKLKEADKYGNSHSIYENDWKPSGDKKVAAPAAKTPLKAREKDDDLPF